MIHFVYITTNLVNDKAYIGKHTTKNLNDGYLGSGLVLEKAIKKYGRKNFKREILEYCDTHLEAYSREEAIIKEFDAVNLETFYNITAGGQGNKGYIPVFTEEWLRKISLALTGKKLTQEHKDNVSKGGKGRIAWNKGKTGIYSEESLQNMRDSHKRYYEINGGQSEEWRRKNSEGQKGRISPMKDKTHKDESKEKIKLWYEIVGFNEEQLTKMRKPREKVMCPHCGKIGGINAMHRFHFENCKFKDKEFLV